MGDLKFYRYQLIRTDVSVEIRDCLLGTGVMFAALPDGMSGEQRKLVDDSTAECLQKLSAYQDLNAAGDWEKHLGFVLGPRSDTAIRINAYQEESSFVKKPKIRLAVLHRISIEHEKDDQGHYQLMEHCDLELPELQQLIAKLQAAEQLLVAS